MEIGIVGKPNVGKSTLFSSITQVEVPIANYPFTTIDSNIGIGYIRVKCVCKEFGVKDNPRNSMCIGGNRFIPIKIVDTAGLVPDAWKGRGLGNQFLSKISMADALIQVIDVSGSTDLDGNMSSPGTYDPLDEILFFKRELVRWVYGILMAHWDAIKKMVNINKMDPVDVLYEKLSGLKFNRELINEVYYKIQIKCGKLSEWNEECLLLFIDSLIEQGKPIVIAANKIDFSVSKKNLERIKNLGYKIFPISALSEFILVKLAKEGIVRYLPGDPSFSIVDRSKLNQKQINGLERIDKLVFKEYGGTGVQQLLNYTVFEVLRYIVVYPVRDAQKLCDKNGNVLPDAYLLPENTSLEDFAYIIHSDLGKYFLYGIDVRNKRRIKGEYQLRNNDVISIVSSR
jgi:hypothetical protein